MVNRHLGRNSKLPHGTDCRRIATQMAAPRSMGRRKLYQNPGIDILHKNSYRHRDTQHLQQYRHRANRDCNCNLRTLRINLHKNTESIGRNARRRGRRAQTLCVLTITPPSFIMKPGLSAWLLNYRNSILKA